MPSLKAVVCSPMHSLGLVWKIFEHADAPAQESADLLRAAEAALIGGLLLADISEAVALAAPKELSGAIELRHVATALAAVGIP